MRTILLLNYLFLSFCCSQSMSYENLTSSKNNLKIENLKAITNFSSSERGYITISGVLVTNSSWKKQTISLQAHSTSWRKKTTIDKDIEILPSSRRYFRLYGEVSSNTYEIKFFVFANSRKIIRSSVQPRSGYNALRILYICPPKHFDASFLAPMMRRDLKQYRTVEIEQIGVQDLPSHWLEYSNIDVIIINSDRPFLEFGDVNNDKAQALLNWLKMGGHLVVSCASNLWLSKNKFMQHLFQLDEITTESHTSKAFENLVFSKTQYRFAHPQQRAIIKDLFWKLDYNYGSITYVGVDLKTYARSESTSNFWLQCLPKQKTPSVHEKIFKLGSENSYIDQAMFTKERAPILSLIIIMMILYFLFIGPINFTFLRKRNKTLYLIFSIPAIALVFCAVVLFYGFFSKGVSNIGKQISIYYPLENNKYYSKEFLAISSGAKNLYRIQGKEKSIVTKIFSEGSENLKYKQDKGLFIHNYPINLWETKFFRIDTVFNSSAIVLNKQGNDIVIDKGENNIEIIKSFYVKYKTREIYNLSNNSTNKTTFHYNKKLRTLNNYGYNTDLLDDNISSHLAKVINTEITNYLKCDNRDFVILLFRENWTPIKTEPSINITEKISALFMPIPRKN
ncbi:hypothetical protein [Candidatus Uabimicrobium sp. HlEnr_7]|uniref:hypothetical protein n=1 Tax=Candidatus Uabimicrobium helgolandensis TaxID=3095367 RepID=UPI0035560267